MVEKYCVEGKFDEAIEAVTWAWEYAHDFPEEADIQEAIALVKQAERYISEEGKPRYKAVRQEVVRRLRLLMYERKRKASRDN